MLNTGEVVRVCSFCLELMSINSVLVLLNVSLLAILIKVIKALYYYTSYYVFIYFETFVVKLRLTHSPGLTIVNKTFCRFFVIAICLFKGKSKYTTKHDQ